MRRNESSEFVVFQIVQFPADSREGLGSHVIYYRRNEGQAGSVCGLAHHSFEISSSMHPAGLFPVAARGPIQNSDNHRSTPVRLPILRLTPGCRSGKEGAARFIISLPRLKRRRPSFMAFTSRRGPERNYEADLFPFLSVVRRRFLLWG